MLKAAIDATQNNELTHARVPYALRRVPLEKMVCMLPLVEKPVAGTIGLAEVERVGKNSTVELADGRRAALHAGDRLLVVFGNRYATSQFEGYAEVKGDRCDLLSMGGICGRVRSKHVAVSDPTTLRLVAMVGDNHGEILRLHDFSAASSGNGRPGLRVIVVCGTSMDSGKTFAATSVIRGLAKRGERVAGIKLTGTGCGRDTWGMADAGGRPALDMVDGGMASTFQASIPQLLQLHQLLSAVAREQGAEWAVVEIADGLLQKETAELIHSEEFTKSVDAWILSAGDALGAMASIQLLREGGIRPAAITGLVSMSPLGIRETEEATAIRCLTAAQVQDEFVMEEMARRVQLKLNDHENHVDKLPRAMAAS